MVDLNAEKQVILKKEVAADDEIFTKLSFLRDAHFISKITEGNVLLSEYVKSFLPHQPVAYELKTNTVGFLLEGVKEIKGQGARLWINTISSSPQKCIGHTDELAVNDPDAHWGALIRLGADR